MDKNSLIRNHHINALESARFVAYNKLEKSQKNESDYLAFFDEFHEAYRVFTIADKGTPFLALVSK